MTSTFPDLVEAIERHARYDFETQIDGLLVARVDSPSEVMRFVYRPSFGLVVSGTKELMVGEHQFHYQPGESLLVAVDVPVTSQVTQASQSEPYLAIHLEINPEVVADLLREHTHFLPSVTTAKTVGKCQLDPELIDPLVRLLSLLNRPRDIAVVAPMIRREIVWRLLHGEHGMLLGQLAFANGNTARIGQATSWIRSNFNEPLRIAELAARLNMSVPSFHRHFKQVTSMAPVQFQKRVRLQEARRRLPYTDSISSLAFSIGYESISQFNRDYRRLFNQTPSDDAAALRSVIQAASDR